MQVDYLVVGSGLTGATIARMLHDAGREVLVVDRRSHLGGNVHDHHHPSGIRIHTYGPHYFRTSSPKIWEYVRRFSEFSPYVAKLVARVEGEYVNWPLGTSYIQRKVGPHWKPAFVGEPKNFEEAALALMPREIYELFVKEYNEKQWGIPAHQLSRELCNRFDVRYDDDPRLKPHAIYQGIPTDGYAKFMESMLKDIPTLLNYDYLKRRWDIQVRRHTVFTGPIDEYFEYQLGRLAYRGQRRKHYYDATCNGFLQPVGQVNTPLHADGPSIRCLEWKHMMPEGYATRIKGTVLTTETPFSPDSPTDYEYPFPDESNTQLAAAYKRLATSIPNLTICGRLGEYKYFDMDQAIGRAMMIAEGLLYQ